MFSVNYLFGQNFKEFDTGFISMFKNKSEFTSYYFGGNPALLDFSDEEEVLSLKNNIQMGQGKFKRFIQPESEGLYQLLVSGKKSIDDNQKFRGSFGFQQEQRNNWDWFYTRDYQSGNPFLIGDSTTGDSRINGIAMNAGYAIKLSKKFSAGITLEYQVDEMLKEVSPKPTSVHRDIFSRVGFNYASDNSLNIGIVADVYDKNERIAYREDEGSITKETIIFKFKGYDYPNVFRKKTETRYSYVNGYAVGLTSSYNLNEEIISMGYFATGFDKTNIKDDETSPMAEGFWKNNYTNLGLQLAYQSPYYFNVGLTYLYRGEDGWGQYSPYNVLYYERAFASHSLVLGIDYLLEKDVTAGIEGGVELTSLKENDHYSAIYTDSKARTLFGKLGVLINWSSYLFTLVSYGYSNNSIPNYTYLTEGNSYYYTAFRYYDLLYYLTGSFKHEFSISSNINAGSWGNFLIHLSYSSQKPFVNSVFGNVSKTRFNSTVEYRAKVF